MKVTEQQVIEWLGSDWKFSELVEILVDVANGDYEPAQMKLDVLEYTEQ